LLLQWTIGIFGLFLSTNYWHFHYPESLQFDIFIFVLAATTCGFALTRLSLFSHELSTSRQRLLLFALNCLLAVIFSFNLYWRNYILGPPFVSSADQSVFCIGYLRCSAVGPINVFLGSFLSFVEYRFNIFSRIINFTKTIFKLFQKGASYLLRFLYAYRRRNRLKIKRSEARARRRMQHATRLTYILIFAQICSLVAIPGCVLTAGFLMFGDIQRLYVDKTRYPSVVGDRVIDVNDNFPDSRLGDKKPLYCGYYQYFSGRAVTNCVYMENGRAYEKSINEEHCKLIHGSSRSPDCLPELKELALTDVISETELAMQVRNEQWQRYSYKSVALFLLLVSFTSPVLIPIFRWLQWRSIKK